ncbi:MAG: serine/threonine-protein kinase [Chloroflexota bacterium]
MFWRLFDKNSDDSIHNITRGYEYTVGDVVEQRFEIEQVHTGYMGIVYIAYDRQRRRRVVLKTFQNKYLWDEQAIQRFYMEADLWIRLGSHPNIVRAYDLRILLGKPHIVAEYVHGSPLHMLIGHLSLQEVIDYAIQICWGMMYAVEHTAIIHGDLKPDNVMVSVEGQVKVTDFGLARALPTWQLKEAHQSHSATQRVLADPQRMPGGTLPYMAPEVFNASSVPGPWSDIYAFGITLFELLTGALPFSSKRTESMIRMHLYEPPPDPRDIQSHIHKGAVYIIQRCLAKRLSDRYQQFTEVEHDLQLLRQHLFKQRFTKTWKFDSSPDQDQWADRGLMHLELHENHEALTCFRQATRINGELAENWCYLARTHLNLWQYDEALYAIDEGLQRASRRPTFGELYQVQGDTYSLMQQPDNAIHAFDKGLSYMPNAPALWRKKGAILLQEGLLREAYHCLKQATTYDKFDERARRLLGDVNMAQNKIDGASQAYNQALRLNPRSAYCWSRYGTCQLKRRRFVRALRAFETALRLEPDLREAVEGAQEARQQVYRKSSARGRNK